jgi:hypothetical protein
MAARGPTPTDGVGPAAAAEARWPQSECYPGFVGYQQKTTRTIPVIALTRRDAPAPDIHQ